MSVSQWNVSETDAAEPALKFIIVSKICCSRYKTQEILHQLETFEKFNWLCFPSKCIKTLKRVPWRNSIWYIMYFLFCLYFLIYIIFFFIVFFRSLYILCQIVLMLPGRSNLIFSHWGPFLEESALLILTSKTTNAHFEAIWLTFITGSFSLCADFSVILYHRWISSCSTRSHCDQQNNGLHVIPLGWSNREMNLLALSDYAVFSFY